MQIRKFIVSDLFGWYFRDFADCKCIPILSGGVKRYASGLLLIVGYNLLAIVIAKKIWSIFFPEIEFTSLVGAVIAIFICFAFIPIIEFCKRYFGLIIGDR